MNTDNLVKFLNRKTVLVSNIKDFYLSHDEILNIAKLNPHLFKLTFVDRAKSCVPDLTRVSLTTNGMNYFFRVIEQECKEIEV